MSRIILSATVGEGTSDLRFQPGINILWGQNADDVLLTLAGTFGGMPPQNGKAEILWNADTVLFVVIRDGTCGVERSTPQVESAAQIVKEFHKQRFLKFDNCTNIFDGSNISAGSLGAGNLLLEKLGDVLAQEDDRPLFVYNFLERLDEAVDLQPVFEALNATGRQVFIAVPHYYETEKMEGKQYVTTVHNVSTP